MSASLGFKLRGVSAWMDRAYRINKFGYLAGMLLALLGVLAASAFLVISIFQRYVQMPEPTYRTVLAITFTVGVAGGVLAMAASAVKHSALFEWARGRRQTVTPEEIFAQSIGFTQTLSRTATAGAIGLGGIAFTSSVIRAGYADTVTVVTCIVGTFILALLCLTFGPVVLDMLLQPLLMEIGSLGGGAGWVPHGHLGPRVLGLVLSFGLLMGVGAAALSAPLGLGAEAFLRVVLTTGLLAASAGLLFAISLTETLLGPVRALVHGTDRVSAGDFLSPVPPMSDDELGALVTSFNSMQQGLRERQALHSAMGAYIDPSIAERVMAEGTSISGEAAEVTVMFLDIVGYTAMAEDAPPQEVVSDLNEFFDIAIPAIVQHGGHANKLLGDGLMAVFGVPDPLENHADCALESAREIQARLQEKYAGALRAGIGLNSGTVVVGSMGGGPKLDYTIIGDAVNVAARIEAFTRQTGDEILLTDATKDLLTSQNGLEPRGTHSLKGRATRVEVWAG
jgi:class 3 adenylate cyclase